jgi:hypothetical protein
VKFSNKDLLVLQDVGDLVACIDRHRAKNALR